MSSTKRMVVILVAIVALAAIALLLATTQPWKSEREKQCERMANANMLTGEEFEAFVDICKGL